MNNEDIIKAFLTQMAKQDNRCTADIYYYVIRTKAKRHVCDGGDEVVYVDKENDYAEYKDREEFAKELRSYRDEDITEDVIETEWLKLEEVNLEHYWEEKGMFLTETDAVNHLKANNYHYSSDAHTYVKHAWRAPELYNFFKALFNHFNIEKKWGLNEKHNE